VIEIIQVYVDNEVLTSVPLLLLGVTLLFKNRYVGLWLIRRQKYGTKMLWKSL